MFASDLLFDSFWIDRVIHNYHSNFFNLIIFQIIHFVHKFIAKINCQLIYFDCHFQRFESFRNLSFIIICKYELSFMFISLSLLLNLAYLFNMSRFSIIDGRRWFNVVQHLLSEKKNIMIVIEKRLCVDYFAYFE